jgi:hypothetical protein
MKFQKRPPVPPFTRLRLSELERRSAAAERRSRDSILLNAEGREKTYAKVISQVQISVEAKPNMANRPKFLCATHRQFRFRSQIAGNGAKQSWVRAEMARSKGGIRWERVSLGVVKGTYSEHLIQLQLLHIVPVGIGASPFCSYNHIVGSGCLVGFCRLRMVV